MCLVMTGRPLVPGRLCSPPRPKIPTWNRIVVRLSQLLWRSRNLLPSDAFAFMGFCRHIIWY